MDRRLAQRPSASARGNRCKCAAQKGRQPHENSSSGRRTALLGLAACPLPTYSSLLTTSAGVGEARAAEAPTPSPRASVLAPRGPVLSKPQTILLGGGQAPIAGPQWLEGCWDFSPVLTGVDFPLGSKFISKRTPGVTKASIVEAADIGLSTPSNPVPQRMRWVRDPESGNVVQDVPFNIASSMDALLGEGTVRNVRVEKGNPRRVSVIFATARRGDTFDQDYDNRKVELFLNYGRGVEAAADDGSGDSTFFQERLWRQVSQAKNQGDVLDYDISEGFRLLEEEREGREEGEGWRPALVQYERRISAFMNPQDPKYFDVGEKTIALYFFSGLMRKAATACS